MSHTVQIFGTDTTFKVSDGKTVLGAAVEAGVDLPHECTLGNCGTCRVKLNEGSVRYREFPSALTKEEESQGYAIICQGYADSDLVITPANSEVDFPEPVLADATIEAVTLLTEDIYCLRLRLPENVNVEYLPGQHMNIQLGREKGERSFSMATACVVSNIIEFHIRRIQSGYFTDHLLSGLREDDSIHVELPRGVFRYHSQDSRPLVFVATGTGFAPIRAILESLLDDEDCPPVSLYWGMRSESDLYACNELESWSERFFEFNFVPVLSRADNSWGGRRGYVQEAIREDYRNMSEFEDDISECAFYICGSPNMVSETKEVIIGMGANIEYIYAESFTPHKSSAPINQD